MESVRIAPHADRTELVFEGRLVAAGVREVHRRLDEVLARAVPIELHAEGLERIDTAGVQLLIAFYRTARQRGLNVQWRSVSPALRASSVTLAVDGLLELPQ